MKKTLLTMSAFAILSIQGFANPWIDAVLEQCYFLNTALVQLSQMLLDLGSTPQPLPCQTLEPVKDDQLRPPCLSTRLLH